MAEREKWFVHGGSLLLSFAGAVCWLSSSCYYDADDVCGNLESSGDVCVCPEGTVRTEAGECLACGQHEVAMGSTCDCEAGYERDDGGTCREAEQPPPSGGGAGPGLDAEGGRP
jgi:hypothetical protein